MKLKVAALVVAAALSGQAFAENYFGANYSIVDADVSKPTALSFKYGSFVSENFSIEGRLALGLTDDNIDGFSGVDAEVDNIFGVYGVFHFSPESTFSPYALVGLTKGKLTVKSDFGSASDDESDFSLGLGFDVKLSETAALNFEWARLIDTDDLEATAISAGLRWSF